MKRQQTRSAILEAAERLFRERGFSKTRVGDIIERVQVSEATFFNYFGTKDAVLGDWTLAWMRAALTPRPAASGSGSLRRWVRDLVRNLAPRIAADREFLAVAFARARLDPGPPEPLTRLFAEAQERGEVRGDLPAAQLAQLATGIALTTVAAWLVAPDPPPLAPRLRAGLELLLDGSRKRCERVPAPAARRPAPSP